MDDSGLLRGGRLRSPLRWLLPVLPLAWLTVRLLLRVLSRLLTVRPLLARIRRLRLTSGGRLTVWPGLLLPVRIRRILPVRRLLPVIAHADKISAQDTWAQTATAGFRSEV